MTERSLIMDAYIAPDFVIALEKQEGTHHCKKK